MPTIGLVIPTLGKRLDYLSQTIESAAKFGRVHIILVTPPEMIDSLRQYSEQIQIVAENSNGLPAAINLGFEKLPEGIEYISWIGDDDLLTPNAGAVSLTFLDADPACVMTFGICNYINEKGELIGQNKIGQVSVPILRFGPDLIPQPGSIFRREIFNNVGGINEQFNLAFDFELFIKLSKVGRIKFLNLEVASFRWHNDSKSVQMRRKSVLEASKVRRIHLPLFLKPVSFFWEVPVMVATYFAGNVVSYKSKRLVRAKN